MYRQIIMCRLATILCRFCAKIALFRFIQNKKSFYTNYKYGDFSSSYFYVAVEHINILDLVEVSF